MIARAIMGLPRPIRLLNVGLVATAAYSVFSLAFLWLAGFSAPVSSLLGNALAGFVSYFGHRIFTFDIQSGHDGAPVRFIALNTVSYFTACLAPWVSTEILNLPGTVAILLTALVIPVVNVLLIAKFVFRKDFMDQGAKMERTHAS